MISSKTSFIALIGNPVKHSLSPIMHNAALKYLDLDLIYLSIPCEEKDFKIVINALKKINCKGLNVTIPFKEKVLKYCNQISPLAQKIKAVNTLKLNERQEWDGINTDVDGLIYPLKEFNLNYKRSIILGSGGAARSAIQGMINLQMSEIIIISRNNQALHSLLRDFKDQRTVKGLLADDKAIFDYISSADLIINTTPVGMLKTYNEDEKLPFGINPWKSLNTKTIVYDLIYNPQKTYLIQYCQNKGCQTLNGTKMLIAQGIKSLAYWTDGLEVPYEIMEKAIKNYL